MSARHYRTALSATILAMALMLNACGTTPPSSFYLLQPMSASASEQTTMAGNEKLHIGVGPVALAEYLDRTQIVTRTDGTRVHLAETHRWAEPLQDNFARIIADNLSTLLNTDRVSLHPSRNWPDIDYQVLINVWQLDASRQGEITLVANWSIRTDNGAELVSMKKSVFTTSVAPDASYADIANAMSSTTAMLSQEIADAIRAQLNP